MTPRPYQYRPSADRLGNAPYVHGPLQPLTPEPRSLFRWFRKKVM